MASKELGKIIARHEMQCVEVMENRGIIGGLIC